jgi:hypothetical protein
MALKAIHNCSRILHAAVVCGLAKPRTTAACDLIAVACGFTDTQLQLRSTTIVSGFQAIHNCSCKWQLCVVHLNHAQSQSASQSQLSVAFKSHARLQLQMAAVMNGFISHSQLQSHVAYCSCVWVGKTTRNCSLRPNSSCVWLCKATRNCN